MTHETVLGLLDDYVDGALPDGERREVEAHLSGCEACGAEARQTAALVARLRGLPPIEPPRDLWPDVARTVRPSTAGPVSRSPAAGRGSPAVAGRRPGVLIAVAFGSATLLAAAAGALVVVGALHAWSSAGGDPRPVEQAMARGDLPGAERALDGLDAAAPAVASDAAYLDLLRGDYAAADGRLAAIEATSPGEVRLRRAIVALRAGDLDAVERHGEGSGLPAGLVLAAEVHLADAEPDAARSLLARAAVAPGPVGATAKQYLSLVDGGPASEGVAEATALWALGQRETAVTSAGDLLTELPDDGTRDETLLVWAGRAVTSGRPEIAAELLDAIAAPPPGQAWRVHATRAMVAVATGDPATAIAIFDGLRAAGAPPDGLADATATAAALTTDPDVAGRLLDGQRSAAAARAFLTVGAGDSARDAAPEGTLLSRYLTGR